MTRRLRCSFLLASLVLTGCGLRDPYAQRRNPPAAVPPAAAAFPAEGVAAATRPAGSAILARFATTWVNWSGASLGRERAELLALAAGPLAAQLRVDAAQAMRSRLQEVSNAYSRGSYVGLIPQAAGGAIVVTYEEVAALGGQPQAAYHDYLARTARTGSGLKVTQWQPASDG